MKDSFGNKVKEGDKVVFISDSKNNPKLKFGVIEKIYKNNLECTVSGHSHVYNYRLMKVDKN